MAIERITRIEGRARPLGGNDIDTDRIIPARFLRSVSFEGLEAHLFADDIAQARASNVTHPPLPAAVRERATETEPLRRRPNDLVQQRSILIVIRVRDHGVGTRREVSLTFPRTYGMELQFRF